MQNVSEYKHVLALCLVLYVFRIANIWNSLPSKDVNAPALNSFQNRLKRFWVNQDMLYNWHAELTGIELVVEVMYFANFKD